MTGFWLALLEVAGILLVFGAAGWLAVSRILPSGPATRAERVAWGFAAGLGLMAVSVALAFVLGIRPGWALAIVCVACVAAGLAFRVSGFEPEKSGPRPGTRDAGLGRRLSVAGLFLLVLAGIGVYALRAIGEPMWSNDFLAIWGMKGKLIFELGRLPERLYRDPALTFSHPEYPLGLPLLYAGISFLLGDWDDHAMALLFPFLQAATLTALWGWLRRRGASDALAMGAAAVLALDAPLYSGFHTGLADIPLSFYLLLLGTSVADAIDGDSRAPARSGLAGFLAASTKNEGVFFVALALLLGWLAPAAVRRRVQPSLSLWLLSAALAAVVPLRLWRGSVPLKDFDFGFLKPTLWGELAQRILETLSVAIREVAWPALPCLAAIVALWAAGRPAPFADRLLAMAAAAALAYLLLPALGVYPSRPELGPIFLVHTALGRTVAALAPLAAAGIAGRLIPLFPAFRLTADS